MSDRIDELVSEVKRVHPTAIPQPLTRSASELLLKHMARLDELADDIRQCKVLTPDDVRTLGQISQFLEIMHREIREGENIAAPDFFAGMDDCFQSLCEIMVGWCAKYNESLAPKYLTMLQGAEVALDAFRIPHSVYRDGEFGRYSSVTVAGITRTV